MIWWFRFWFGLPARSEDVDEMRRCIPEIFESGSDVGEKLAFPLWKSSGEYKATMEALRHWAKTAENFNKADGFLIENCPAENCPLKQVVQPSEESSESSIIGLMVAAGFGTPPKNSFLDLVRRVHKGQTVRKVILTDRYIYDDKSEEDYSGGYATLIEYLAALKLNQDSSFELFLNPMAKSQQSSAILQRTVKKAFPKAEIKSFEIKSLKSHGGKIHDRFYLTCGKSDKLSGLFGPSLNALNSHSLVLMGQLETKALEWLERNLTIS
ncbi:MAG: hypothetical protein DCC63_03290 [Nitrospira sp.]|nr:MAG: hypothetical protein DCC63_03290 [Nitrospira sp.]